MKGHFNTALTLSLGIHLAVLGGLPASFMLNREPVKHVQPKTEFVEIQRKEKIKIAKDSTFEEPPPT